MYAEELQDHFKFPRNKGTLVHPDISVGDSNPSCGDRVHFYVNILDGKISELKFEGEGCVISQAAASMLSEHCKHMKLDLVLSMTKEDIISILNLSLGPTRLRCALLCLEVLQRGVMQLKQ